MLASGNREPNDLRHLVNGPRRIYIYIYIYTDFNDPSSLSQKSVDYDRNLWAMTITDEGGKY